MKRKIIMIFALLLSVSSALESQEILTLKQCYEMADAASALASEKEHHSGIWELRDRNLAKGWLPTIDAGGSFVYNSEVIDISNSLGSLPIPGIAEAIEPLPHEQYKLTIDINQVIYDGGSIRGARELEMANLRINEKQTEADMYNLRGQINNCYFNILLLQQQKKLLTSYLLLVEKRITSMQSAFDNGMILQSDIDIMLTEKIRLRQQMEENEIKRASLIRLLADLTGSEISDDASLKIPDLFEGLPADIKRPEMELFDLRKEQLDAGMKLINSKRMPKAFGFATLGYGNPPGNNFFRDEFAPFYIVGGGVKWNIFDWNKAKNEKQIMALQETLIDSRKEDMNDNLKRLLETKNSEILSLTSLLSADEELIALRKKITASAESQYENGMITATELLHEINSEKQAAISYEIHKTGLALAKVEYLNICGKEL
ncbi:MAG: TolC family protein [Bacteroidales bacterium]|nr:TolC family protein [Bacteroidales bacterium]